MREQCCEVILALRVRNLSKDVAEVSKGFESTRFCALDQAIKGGCGTGTVGVSTE